MGFLDDLLGKIKRAPAPRTTDAPAPPAAPVGAPAKAPVAAPKTGPISQSIPKAAPAPAAPAPTAKVGACGPLRLAPGDHVAHYKARFMVVGARVLERQGGNAWHYCLRDASGAAAVLAASEGGDGACSLQHVAKGDLAWDADVQKHDGGSFKLARRGKAKVRAWADAGAANNARTVEYREFEDASSDRVLAMEDWQGRREARVGDVVFDSELTFERAAERPSGGTFSKAAAMADAFEEAPEADIVKGTPRAAARVLEQNVGATKVVPGAAPVEEHDPTGYEDDAWADSKDDASSPTAGKRKAAAAAAPAPVTKSGDETDEWSAAAEVLRDAAGPDAKRA